MDSRSLASYLNSRSDRLQEGALSPFFTGFASSLNDVYQAALATEPADVNIACSKFLMICPKSMLSAACIIAEGQPEDSFAITRRAVECAQVALARKLDPASEQKWLAQTERVARWDARGAGAKPKRLTVSYSAAVTSNSLFQQLNEFLGVQSETYVHFTPEFYGTLEWTVKTVEGAQQIGLNLFRTDPQQIERALGFLAVTHGVILKAFDFSLDGYLAANSDYKAATDRFWTVSKMLMDAYHAEYSQVRRTEQPERKE